MQPGIFTISRTTDELSIVCLAIYVPSQVQAEADWACMKLQGPFPFDMTGVLAAFLNPLADTGIGIFAISTFDTDYVLVKADRLGEALATLDRAGHTRVS